MNDSPLDREIQAALNIEPSPEFLVRVRARLEREPMPAAWHFDWRFVAVGAAVMAALVLAVVWLRPVRNTAAPGVTGVPLPANPPGLAQPGPVTGTPPDAAVLSAPLAARAPLPLKRVARRSRDPEVLVNASEIAAFQHLLRSLSDDRVDMSSLARGVPDATTALPEIGELALAPLSVELLEPVTQ